MPRPILCLSRSIWDDERTTPRNRYQILSRLARRRHVTFVERPFECATLAHPSRAKLAALTIALGRPRRHPEGVMTVRPLAWLQRDGDDRAWWLNDRLYRPWLRHARALAGDDPIVWIYDARLIRCIDESDNATVVYHCTEDYGGIARAGLGDRAGAWMEQCEIALARQADWVFAVSDGIAEKLRPHSRAIQVIRNAVDLDIFRAPAPETPVTRELDALPRPILTYVGEIGFKIDFDLIGLLADRFAAGSLVLIGPVDRGATARLDALRAKPNVHVLGHRPVNELPGLIDRADVCLMPFITDNWFSAAAQPLKTFEYLARGKPIVASWMPNLATIDADIAICRGHAEFLERCEALLRMNSPMASRRRIAAAEENGWDERVAAIESVLEELDQRRGRIA